MTQVTPKQVLYTCLLYLMRFIFFILLIVFVSIPMLWILFFPDHDLSLSSTISTTCFLVICCLYYLYQRQLKKHNPVGYGTYSFNKNIGYFLIMILALLFITHFMFENVLQIESPENQKIIEILLVRFPITMSIFAIAGAPIAEELLFRGIFFNYFFTKNTYISRFSAIFFSALLFGLLHEISFSLTLLYYFLMGVFLAMTYAYTRDIRYPILIHIINNAVSVYAVFYDL
ncbi:lysostaphin resistance A-like protein [Ignatzschineria sp. LJL83]